MIKNISLLLVLAGLAACGGAPKSFTTFPHSSSQTPRLHAATIDERLLVRPSLELRVLGVPFGYVQSSGLIGVEIDRMEAGKSKEAIYPLIDALSGFSFKDHFEKTLREKVLSPGYLPARDVRYEIAPDRFSKMRSGTVVINAYQRISMLLSTLWVGVSAHHYDDSSGSLQVRRTIYLYEYRLPQAEETFSEREINADEWLSHSVVVEHLLKTGMESAMDMLVSDLKGEIVIEQARPVNIGWEHLLGRSPKMHLVAEKGDRIVIADRTKTMVASITASALEDSEVKPKTLAQIKMESGISNTPSKNERAMLTGANSGQGIVDFMGQAENEILSKTYDKNLWAKALADAGGDPQKRQSIYIKLRARQLYAESGGRLEPRAVVAAPAPAAEAVEFNLAGKYETRLSGYTFYFTRQKNQPVVRIRQDGNNVEGDIGSTGTFTGVIEDNQLELEWITALGEGTARLKISRSGRKLKGEWKSAQEGRGSWTMRSVSPVRSVTPVTPSKQKKVMPTAADTTTEYTATGGQGVVAFMGQAENEILSKTYDKNLWARALVDAEGDPQKRVSIYITLRAQQLHVESGGTLEPRAVVAAAAPAAETVEFSLGGRYDTRVKGQTFYFTRKKDQPVVRFRQNGNNLEGEIGSIGTFTGVIKDHQLELEWITTYGVGTAKLKISRSGRALKGKWKNDQGGQGSWTMQRR